jgi:hypothetical protein
MASLNAALSHPHDVVTWKFKGDNLEQSPPWTSNAFWQNIKITRKWVGSDDQLETAINTLRTSGYLAISEDSYSVTTQCINWLLNHARAFHKAIFDEEPPTDWTREKGDWLEFNGHVFERLYDNIGDSWRDVRNAINLEISAHRPVRKQKTAGRSNIIDHLGESPANWLVVSVAGLLDDVSELRLMTLTNDLGLSSYADGLEKLSEATRLLRNADILESDSYRLTPKFARRMVDVRNAIQKHIPELRADCVRWKSKRSAEAGRTRSRR